MHLRLPLLAVLLASASCTANGGEDGAAATAAAASAAPAPASASAAEDARLIAFLDAAFEEQIATNPQFLTSLGSKRLYHRSTIIPMRTASSSSRFRRLSSSDSGRSSIRSG
jgi:CRP-like cAMP-binding protein